MKHPPPLLSDTRVEAYSASALRFVCWVFGVLARWGFSGRSQKLRDTLHRAERAVELTLFLHAVARLGPLPNKKRRPISTPTGFRVTFSRGHLFYKRANIRARKASAPDRVFALLDALQHPDRAIAYFLKRIRKGLRSRRLVVAAPIAEALFSACVAARPTLDTS
ncbi:MAG: hypothetical protein NT015_18405 [Alphaproteobacteria bacterium]|nr:hypothetical protein [Alphaproteobacteria bacterium]